MLITILLQIFGLTLSLCSSSYELLNSIFHQEYAMTRDFFLPPSLKGHAIILVNGSKVSLLQEGNSIKSINFQPIKFHQIKAISHVPVTLWLLWTRDPEFQQLETRARLLQIRQIVMQILAETGEKNVTHVQFLQKVLSFVMEEGTSRDKFLRFLGSIQDDLESLVSEATLASLTSLHESCKALLCDLDIRRSNVWAVVSGGHMPEANNAYLNYMKAAIEPTSRIFSEGRRTFYATNQRSFADVIRIIQTHLVDVPMGKDIFGDSQRMHSDLLGPASEKIIKSWQGKKTLPIYWFSRLVAERLILKNNNTSKQQIANIEFVVPPPIQSSSSHESLYPVEEFARKNGFRVHYAPPKSLKNWSLPLGSFEIGLVVSFGYFIPSRIINAFSMGALNVHPSLLPLYRGSAPIARAIMNGDRETGVSIIDLHPKAFDCGKIWASSRMDLPRSCFYSDVESSLAERGADHLTEILGNYETFKANAKEQPFVTEAPTAPKIHQDDCVVSLSEMTAHQIWNRYRALKEHRFRVGLASGIKFHEIIDPMLFPSHLNYIQTADLPECPGSFLIHKFKGVRYILIVCKDKTILPVTHFIVPRKSSICLVPQFLQWYENQRDKLNMELLIAK